MSANYHTALSTTAKIPATGGTINTPLSELDTQISTNTQEIEDARGTKTSLDARLDEEHNDDGTHKSAAVKSHASSHESGGSDELDVADLADATNVLLTPTQLTDLIDSGLCLIHDHKIAKTVIWADSSVGGASGTAAPALTEYVFQNPGTTGAHEEIKIRIPFFMANTGIQTAYLNFEAYIDNGSLPGSAGAKIQLDIDGHNDEEDITVTSYDRHEATVDISSLTLRELYEVTVRLIWTNSLTNSDNTNLYMRHPVLLIEERTS